MRKIFGTLFGLRKFKKLELCAEHTKDIDLKDVNIVNKILPYATDQCESCHQQICHACGENHVKDHCHIKCNFPSYSVGINEDLGTGVLRNFNLGELIKVDTKKLTCICGKPFGPGSAICAACGMASCSEACHQRWESMGNCRFKENFYSIPEGFSMRSILYDNIAILQKSKIRDWAIANKSSLSMVSAYVSGSFPYIYLQRGIRNYGIPNEELLSIMEPVPRNLDYYLFAERRCDCECSNCTSSHIHTVQNCEGRCFKYDLNFMKELSMVSKYHKQCNCPCELCNSGIIATTHRFIDCMHYCERSRYNNDKDPSSH